MCTEFDTNVQEELSSIDCRSAEIRDCGGSDMW